MHILLLILKILGITLASIVGLILLLLIIILAVPIRYRFELKVGDQQQLTVKAGVYWLLYLISVRTSFLDRKLSYHVKLCGVQIAGNQPEFLEEQEKKKQKKSEKERKKHEKESRKENTPETVSSEPQPVVSEPMTMEPAPTTMEPALGAPVSETPVPEPLETKPAFMDRITGIPDLIKEKCRIVLEKIKRFFKKIKDLYVKISDRLKQDKKEDKEEGKLKKYKDLFDIYNKNGTVAFLLKYLKKIIKHVLPRKLSGYVKFGLDDPSTTGYITAAAAVLFPIYGKSFSYEPNFFEKELDVDLHGHGKIRLGYFVFVGVRLILKKNVRQLVKDIRNI